MRSIAVLLVLNLLFAGVILSENGYTWDNFRQRVIGQGMAAMAKGWIGPGDGWYGNTVDLSGIEAGDILLGGNDEATYGRYTHAGLCDGKGYYWEVSLEAGVRRKPVSYFTNYTRACLLRVNASPEKRRAAVRYMAAHEGEIYYAIAFKPGEKVWNCTKTLWLAYKRAGIEIDGGQDLWVIPDNIRASGSVRLISESEGGLP